ncbi:MAG TPA: FtsX-like permease family protein [Actinomycetota bacterium]|nr:FtsX-like permease family protein [Actinomycetota bacterium]
MSGLLAIVRMMNVRHFVRRRLRTGLTVTGVAAGVALVFSIAIINSTLLSSFRHSLRELAGNAEIEVASADQAGIPARWVAEIAQIDGVERAVPVVRATTRVTHDEASERVLLVGVTPDFTALFPRGLGRLAEVRVQGGFGGDRDVLLSGRVAETLDVSRGDAIEVEAPRAVRSMAVSGTVTGGALAAFNGGNVGLMTLGSAQEVFGKADHVDSIYVVTSARSELGDVTRSIERVTAGGDIVGPPGERGRGLERVFGGLGTLLSLAGTVSLLVALFVVYNTMSMSLAERRREISMAMSLGATRAQVFAAFLAEACVFGILATALGIAGGLSLAKVLVERAAQGYEIFAADVGGPLVVTPWHVVVAVTGGIGVALLGAYLPARKVMSVAPIEALRPDAAYEWTGPRPMRRALPRLAVGVVGIAGGGASFVLTGIYPDAEWIVQFALIGGFIGVTFLLPFIVPFAVTVIRPFLIRGFGTVGRLSADALAKNPGRTTFTVAALVLTLGLVVAVASALGSYQAQVDRMANAIIGAPIYVSARSYTGITSDQPLAGELQEDIEAVEGVSYVYPIRSVFLNIDGEQGLMFAIDVKDALTHGATSVMSAITDDPDAFLNGLEDGGIAIAKGTARRHDVGVGGQLSLKTPTGVRAFDVAAIYNDLVSFDALYIDHGTYTRFWNDEKVDQFGVLVEEGSDVDPVHDRLQNLVARERVPAHVLRKEELIGRILDTVEGTFALGQGIQLAALVVAAITIANTMFTAVLERRWEMGLQRALGMGGRQLRGSVLLEAAGIGVIGGIGGVILGTVAGFMMMRSMEAQFQWEIQFQAPLALWALAIVGATALAALVGAGPSRAATRASIIESLRYE